MRGRDEVKLGYGTTSSLRINMGSKTREYQRIDIQPYIDGLAGGKVLQAIMPPL